MYRKELLKIIENAFAEDVKEGDHTSMACIGASAKGKAQLIIKMMELLPESK
jgi:nicotinate-nucleotide pyrophosphorylase (carboxylating)